MTLFLQQSVKKGMELVIYMTLPGIITGGKAVMISNSNTMIRMQNFTLQLQL